MKKVKRSQIILRKNGEEPVMLQKEYTVDTAEV